MNRIRQVSGVPGGFVYGAVESSARPAKDYTVRLIPRFDGVAVPLEEARILWQR
jgi:starch phosphorylase